MIKATIKSNFLNEAKIYPSDTTVADILADNNLTVHGNAMTTANGIIITEENVEMPISEFAAHDEITIMSIVKGDGNR